MKATDKIWGKRCVVHQDSTHTTNILWLRAGHRCSWHSHQTKWNLFVVLQGLVGVRTEEGEKLLHLGEEALVAPGKMHEFRVYEDGVMLEVMYVEYDDDDIEREILGGELSDIDMSLGKERK